MKDQSAKGPRNDNASAQITLQDEGERESIRSVAMWALLFYFLNLNFCMLWYKMLRRPLIYELTLRSTTKKYNFSKYMLNY
jgi:hypothetical protein